LRIDLFLGFVTERIASRNRLLGVVERVVYCCRAQDQKLDPFKSPAAFAVASPVRDSASAALNRELLKISAVSGLLGRFCELVAKRIQWLAANSVFFRKQ